jgi:hypothetical protein
MVNVALRQTRGETFDSLSFHLPTSNRSFESPFNVFESLGEEYAVACEPSRDNGSPNLSQAIFRTRALQRLQGFDLAAARPEADLVDRLRAGGGCLYEIPRKPTCREPIGCE